MNGFAIENRLPRHLVLLQHECPGTPTHVDWMVASDISGHKPLKTYRITHRLDLMDVGDQQTLTPLGNHRPRYLRCDGPLSGDRGVVKRLARGRLWATTGADALKIHWKTGLAAGRIQWVRLIWNPAGEGLDVCCEGWNGPER